MLCNAQEGEEKREIVALLSFCCKLTLNLSGMRNLTFMEECHSLDSRSDRESELGFGGDSE